MMPRGNKKKKDNKDKDRSAPHSNYSYYQDKSPASSVYSVPHSNAGRGRYRGFGRGGVGSGSLIQHNQESHYSSNNYTQSTSEFNYEDRYNKHMYRQNDARPSSSFQRPHSVYGDSSLYVDRPSYAYDKPADKRCQKPTVMQKIENRVGGKPKSKQIELVQFTVYFCPQCGHQYNFRYQPENRHFGKIPLILHCSHTMCQECIYQGLKNSKVSCPTCAKESVLTKEQAPVCQSDMQTIFLPNFYILGVVNYYFQSSNNYLKNLNSLSLVSATESKKAAQPVLPSPSERCCFASCEKQATLFCPSCEGIYCKECCIVLHKSAKNLMAHEPVPRRSSINSLNLENCDIHPEMQVDFYCKTCELSSCCYCVLDKHSAHERTALYKLEPDEMEEFKKLQKNAEAVLRQILSAQKKAARMVNFDTGPVKKEISGRFANSHGKLQAIEKKMCDELEGFKTNHKGLDNIQSSLMSSAELIKSLVALNEEKIGDKKLNLRGALDKLRTIENIPIFLINQNGHSDPVRFVIKSETMDNIEENYVIEKCDDSEFRLVTKNELPENYVIESDTEVDVELNTLIKDIKIEDYTVKSAPIKTAPQPSSGSTNESKNQSRRKSKTPARQKLDTERVDVLHVDSMFSFYVHYKYQQPIFRQLKEDIEKYIKMDGTQIVKDPELNELYLACYKFDSQKEENWQRARVVGITNTEKGPAYEMFFIDLGKTEVVDWKKITALPSILAKQQPLAIQCSIYNAMVSSWHETAHYSLLHIIQGKETYVTEMCYRNGIHEVDLMVASLDGGLTSVTDMLVHVVGAVVNDNEDSTTFIQPKKGKIILPSFKIFPNSSKFTKNQTEKVIIANVIDPDNIFVHLVKDVGKYKQMNLAIKKYYKAPTTKACFPIEGSYAIVEYKDSIRSNWHRALIKNVDLKTNKVQAMLVDWGLNVFVPTSKIRPLIETFTKLETQVVLLKLYHIVPYNKQMNWSSQMATNFLQFYQTRQEELKMIVYEHHPKIEVALFEITGNVDICINTKLVDNNFADSVGPISTILEWPQYEAPAPVSEQGGFMSTLLQKVNDEANGESDSEDASYAGVKKRRVDVIKVEDPNNIWVKYEDLKNKERELIKGLSIHYSQEKHKKDKWEIGIKCVTEDENAYVRGTVLEQISENSYKIYLYDKVKEITTTVDKIYVLDNFLARYPQVALKAHLAYIRPAGDTGKWSIAAIEALQEIFNRHKRIYAIMVQEKEEDVPNKSIPLDMWYGLVIQGGPLEPDRLKYVSISNALVKLGWAFRVQRPVIPKKTISVTAEIHEVKTASNGDDLMKSLLNISDSETPAAADKVLEVEDTSKADDAEGNKLSNEEANVLEKDEIEISQEHELIENIGKKFQEISEKMTAKKFSDQESWNAIIEEEMEHSKSEINSDDEDKESTNSSPYHKSEVAIDDWMPAYRLKNREFRGRVTCVETSGNLYVHDESLHNIYNLMETNIKEYFDTKPPRCTEKNWQTGQLCTIKFTDGKWYRGKVLKVIKPDLISVFMIDFGSDHEVSPDALFREVLYIDLGAFATRVRLDQVYSRSGTWLTSDYDHFMDLCSDWCRIVVKGPLEVELPLVDVYNESGVFVNRKLVELCPNLSMCSNFPIQTEEEEEDACIVIESEECANEVMKSLMERLEMQLVVPHYNNTSRSTYSVRPVLQELLDGEKVLMEIGGILNYDRILFHLPDNDVSEVIYNLILDIQDIVGNLPNLTTFTVGTPCLAPFSEDNVWYRAKIMGNKPTSEDLFDVLFVDYGNSQTVAAKDLKIIPNDYLELAQQTWEASLNVTLEKTGDFINVMQVINALDKKKIFVKLVNENPLVVDLFDKNGKMCYANLIDNGSLKQLM
ncbi:unnamed protein product [Ceutorhynchus assimilis]|uniref:RING finger protein 17 n=1 Tax=Ceutorhynchus assimilis TaxID=467358 RepID=A0A9P0DJB2_9CUCU|nr:unnamed protein product [Ceutorhynchus assimilis]